MLSWKTHEEGRADLTPARALALRRWILAVDRLRSKVGGMVPGPARAGHLAERLESAFQFVYMAHQAPGAFSHNRSSQAVDRWDGRSRFLV